MDVGREHEAPKFARLPDNAEVSASDAGEFLGQPDDPSKPISADRIRQYALGGRLHGRKLNPRNPQSPWLFRMGVLRRFKATGRQPPARPPHGEYDFEKLPDAAVVVSARAAAKYVGYHPNVVARLAARGATDPDNPRLLHGRKPVEGKGGAWEFTMKELRRFKRARRGEDDDGQPNAPTRW